MSDIKFTVGLSNSFNQDGIPKRPVDIMAYSTGFNPTVTDGTGLSNHILSGQGWTPVVFAEGTRKGKNFQSFQVLACEYDLVKVIGDDGVTEEIDWDASRKACPSIEQVIELGKQGLISLAHVSQSGDVSTGIFSGRLVAFLSESVTDPLIYKPCSEVFHRDIEKATGLPINDRCGTDKARWWAGTNNPENLVFLNPAAAVYDTQELLKRAQEEVIAAEPYKYQERASRPPSSAGFSKTVMRVVKWIFTDGLPPPDAASHSEIVTPAKALARLMAPAIDDEFCYWLSSSQYRLQKIGGDPHRFLYAGDEFDNASLGWFIRRVDKAAPDWRERFKEEFGYSPGLDDFNPNNRGASLKSMDF